MFYKTGNEMMKKWVVIFLTTLSCIAVLGCDDDDSSVVASESVPEESASIDTVFVNSTDTVFMNFIDTAFVDRLDTVFVDRLDTVVVEHRDTLTLTSSGLVKKCRTSFDSSFVPGYSLFWGNSLLLGYQDFGMSASAADKDYYWQIEDYFIKNKIDFTGNRVTGSFENMTTLEAQEQFLKDNIYPHLEKNPGLIVIQLGDNIDENEEFFIMEESISHVMERICSMADSARVLWVGEWYSTPLKQFLLKRLADDYGITFVDISDLNTSDNQARLGDVNVYPFEREFSLKYDSYEVNGDSLTIRFYSEDSLYASIIKISSYEDDSENKRITWTGKEFITADVFVASHPNDKAFKEISKRIMAALGY